MSRKADEENANTRGGNFTTAVDEDGVRIPGALTLGSYDVNLSPVVGADFLLTPLGKNTALYLSTEATWGSLDAQARSKDGESKVDLALGEFVGTAGLRIAVNLYDGNRDQDTDGDKLSEKEKNFRPLNEVLGTEWTVPPAPSGIYQVGSIFYADNTFAGQNCLTTEASKFPHVDTELVRELQAGVSVNVGSQGGGVSTDIVQRLKLGTVNQSAVPDLSLELTDSCRRALQTKTERGESISGAHIVTEALSAQITQQTCGKVDAKGRFKIFTVADLQADATLKEACTVTSLEPVVVGYKTASVEALLSHTKKSEE